MNSNDEVTYVEYVSEATDHPDYEAAVRSSEKHKIIVHQIAPRAMLTSFCRKKGLVFTKGDAHGTIKEPNRDKGMNVDDEFASRNIIWNNR